MPETRGPIGPNRVDPEGEFLDNVVNKGDGILLVVTAVDLERPYPGGVIDGSVLKTSNSMSVGVLEARIFKSEKSPFLFIDRQILT